MRKPFEETANLFLTLLNTMGMNVDGGGISSFAIDERETCEVLMVSEECRDDDEGRRWRTVFGSLPFFFSLLSARARLKLLRALYTGRPHKQSYNFCYKNNHDFVMEDVISNTIIAINWNYFYGKIAKYSMSHASSHCFESEGGSFPLCWWLLWCSRVFRTFCPF